MPTPLYKVYPTEKVIILLENEIQKWLLLDIKDQKTKE